VYAEPPKTGLAAVLEPFHHFFCCSELYGYFCICGGVPLLCFGLLGGGRADRSFSAQDSSAPTRRRVAPETED